ncbi:MAG: insulinase family protein [Ruminococcaceae bacterium]|nr:insulinase family protein [Oscillospiraceae bacterium]
MFLNKEKISDAIDLASIKTDKFKSSVISFSMTLPLTKKDFAHNLLLSHLLCRGTKSYPSNSALNKRLDELYGSYVEIKSHRIGENISLNIIAEILDNKFIPDNTDVFEEIIKIVSELILSPAFLQKDFNVNFFEQEKKLICDSINAEINNTRVYAAKRCAEIMHDSTNIPNSKELKELITNTSIDNLLEYHRYLITHAPINIFYVGSQDGKIINNKISLNFSKYPYSSKLPLVFPRAIKRGNTLELSEEMQVSQGKLALGFSLGVTANNTDDLYYTAIMLNEILGGSASSKLFLNVREKLSLCYYCSSSFSIYSGIMLISAGFEVKNYEIARNAIFEQIEDIKHGNISDVEFHAAQKSVTNSYRQLYDSPFDIQAFFGDRSLFNITDNIEDTINKLLHVTKADVIKFAENIKFEASYFVKGTSSSNAEEEDLDE